MSGNKKILITGGLGNLGSWLTIYLSKIYDIYVLSKDGNRTVDANYTLIKVDILNEIELKNKLENINFDYCIHAASYNEHFHEEYAKKALLINALGTRNLLDFFSKHTFTKVKFIYFSTFHIYGITSGFIDENTLPNPKNDYATTHLFAEYYLKQFHATHNIEYIIFRLTNSYGAPKTNNFTKWYLVLNELSKMAYKKKRIILKSNGESKRDFIWMGDVVQIVDLVLKNEHCLNKTYNLGSGKIYSIKQLAQFVQFAYREVFEEDLPIEINLKDTNKYEMLEVDCSKLMKDIGYYSLNEMFIKEIKNIFKLLKSI